ncbi:NAD(P)H-binding protein [Mesorhizobium sp. M1E.F.Ca.ET.041.01.1.1]|uniref:NAD(P)H-binding protein n=1 Tax=Mesorhizobium sp. M1E.F.Ca.ET.041.01.1.1 TaxID=2496759 RepID=UPI000FCC718F|nr:NAD(P)H-binding protein [Mesorhizobium sp. M1E.F.Ca.ET.041.01.1.1]RUW25062.1 SDR family NAD(P)-dependent oxidoreductase [Mesorhizobium sp. M1E.F.Ca.ET.041.01.1.1]
MNIGVSGASGNLGQAIVRELQARNNVHKIIAISRTPKSSDGVEGRVGDYDKPETLATAYAGLDKVILIPTSDLRPGMRGSQNEAAIAAAVAAGVKHIVLLSAAGTREQAEPAIGASYWRGEQALIKTAAQWTILRMNYYAEALAQEAQSAAQSGMLTGFAENKVAFVGREDVAAAAAGIVLGEGHVGAIYNATGAKSYTGAERAALLADIVGKPIAFAAIPVDALKGGMAQMGLPDFVINAVAGIQQDFANGAFDVVTGDVEKLAGRAPQDLRDVLAANLK